MEAYQMKYIAKQVKFHEDRDARSIEIMNKFLDKGMSFHDIVCIGLGLMEMADRMRIAFHSGESHAAMQKGEKQK